MEREQEGLRRNVLTLMHRDCGRVFLVREACREGKVIVFLIVLFRHTMIATTKTKIEAQGQTNAVYLLVRAVRHAGMQAPLHGKQSETLHALEANKPLCDLTSKMINCKTQAHQHISSSHNPQPSKLLPF